MATIANTFTLHFEDKKFKNSLAETQKYSQQYQKQIADSLLKTARLQEIKAKLSERLANAQKNIDKDEVARRKIQITRTNELIRAEASRRSGIKSTISHLNTLTNAENKNALAQQNSTKIIGQQAKSTENLANQTIRYLRWAGTIAGVVYAGKRAWDATLGTGIEVNKIIESNTMGIAALTSANTRMVDSLGNTLTPFEKFAMGQKVATKAVDDLRAASVKTYATFPQLLEIYQQAIGQTMSMGGAFGETVDEVSANTIELSKTLSNIAGSIGMPMDRVREEIRSMLSGNASTDSLISTMLFGSPGEANKAIRDAKGRTNGVVDLLNDMMKDFKILEETRTYQKGLLTLQDSWSRAMSGIVEDSGMFADITDMFYDMSASIVDNTDEIIDTFDSIYFGVKEVADISENLIIPAATIASVYALRTATLALTAAAVKNPYIAVLTATAVAGSFAIEYFEELEGAANDLSVTLGKTPEIIKKDSIENIRKDKKAITKELNELTDTIFNLQKDVDNIGFLELNSEKKQDKKNLEEALKYQKKLEDQLSVLDEKTRDYAIAQEKLNTAKESGEAQAKLLLNIGVDNKLQEKFRKDTESSKEKLLKLEGDLLEATTERTKLEQTLSENIKAKTLDEAGRILLTESIEVAKKAELSYEEQIAKIKLEAQIKQETIKGKLFLSEQALIGIEEKKSDAILREIDEKSRLLAISQDQQDIDKRATELNLLAVKYEKEIINEKEKYKRKESRDLARILKATRDQQLEQAKLNDLAQTSAQAHAERVQIQNNYKESLSWIINDSVREVELANNKKDLTKETVQEQIKQVGIERELASALDIQIGKTSELLAQRRELEQTPLFLEATERGVDDIYLKLMGLSDIQIDLAIETDQLDKIADAVDSFDSMTQSIMSSADAMMELAKGAEALSKISSTSMRYALEENKLTDQNIKLNAKKTEIINRGVPSLENQAELQEINVELAKNQYAEYSNMASALGSATGAMAGLASEGSTAQKMLLVTQQALATTAAVTAILMQAGPDPTAPARMAIMATIVSGLLASAGIAFSGGGTGTPAPSQGEKRLEQVDLKFDPITDRLDAQIGLLEEISKDGAVARASYERAKVDYDRSVENLIGEFGKGFGNYIDTRIFTKQSFNENQIFNAINQINTKMGTNLFSLNTQTGVGSGISQEALNFQMNWGGGREELDRIRIDLDKLNLGNYFDFVSAIATTDYGQFLTIPDMMDDWGDALNDADLYFNEFVVNAQNSITEFVTSTLSTMNELVDFGKELGEMYDQATGGTEYYTLRLERATGIINDLLAETNKTYEEFIFDMSKTLLSLEDNLSREDIDLLLSSSVEDLGEQASRASEIYKDLDESLQQNVLSLLDNKEAVELYNNAIAKSNENIKVLELRNETEEDRITRLGIETGLMIDVSNINDKYINTLIERAKIDGFVTDAEKEAIQESIAFGKSIGTVAEAIEDASTRIADEAKKLKNQIFEMSATDAEKRAKVLSELDPSNRAYQELIYSIEDAQEAYKKETEAKKESLQKQSDALRDYISNVNSSISTLENTFDSLQNIIDSLREPTKTAETRLSDFYNAMKIASGSSVTDSEMFGSLVEDAISASSALLDTANFSNQRDMDFAQLVAANQFESLASKTMTQIDYLKMIEENTREQVSLLSAQISGLDENITSSIQGIAASKVSDFNTRATEYLARYQDVNNFFYGTGQYEDVNYTETKAYQQGAKTPEEFAIWHFQNYGKNEGRSFAVGTPNVPYDMDASIHQGEGIIPKTFNEGIKSGDYTLGNNRAMESTFKSMEEKMQAIESENKALRSSMERLIDISNRQLATQQATFSETTKVYQAVSA